MIHETNNLRIQGITPVVAPETLYADLPISETAADTVFTARNTIHDIYTGKDKRLLTIVGPCSIHDVDVALEYAERLEKLREQYKDSLYIIMRVYFEKPRTTVGWKGLINDPELDDSFKINDGLHIARKLLLDLANRGMPAGVEYLDLISPQYIADLVSWGAIGARTTESQGHRQLASGLSCPVGFKNGTGGDLQVAVDAVGAARNPHHFLSVTKEGSSAIFQTTGNEDCHIILRGGMMPNYDAASVDDASEALEKSGLPARVMIDTSHANSRKIPSRQLDVARSIACQLEGGDDRIFGVMVESNIVEGRQDVKAGQGLKYGQSITDACLGWDSTEKLISTLAKAAAARTA